MRKFLIINPFGIGDVLFTTPALSAIRRSCPNAFIGYWCNERVQEVLSNNPCISKVFALSRGDLKRIYNKSRIDGLRSFLRLLYNIKKEKFDISLDFSLEHRYSLVSKLLGIKRRVGFNYKNRGKFLTDRVDVGGYNGKHVVEYYQELLRPLRIDPLKSNLVLGVRDTVKHRVRSSFSRLGIGENDILVGIAPAAGASWGKDAAFKHWPALKFAQLADIISVNLGAKVLLLGDQPERLVSDIIVNAASRRPFDLTGKTSLEELTAVIGSLRILITNDGGPLHIAVAQGIRTVSIFGPVDDLVYGPYPAGDKHIVVKTNVPCRPCYKDFKMPQCERARECIDSITVDEVFSAVRRLT